MLGHKAIAFKHVAGSGKAQVPFDDVNIDKAAEYAAEDADVTLRLWRALKPRLPAEQVTTVYETLERPLIRVLGADGAARHLDRPADALAAVGRVRPEGRRIGSGDPRACRRAAQSRQPETARRHPVRQVRPAGRNEDKDGRVVDGRASAGRAGRAGPRPAAEDSRLAAGGQTPLDLYGRPARLCKPRHPSGAHLLLARVHHHWPAVVLGTQPAEHPDPHRGRAQDPPRLRGLAGNEARLGRLFADRAAPACPRLPTCLRCARRFATGSTSMR